MDDLTAERLGRAGAAELSIDPSPPEPYPTGDDRREASTLLSEIVAERYPTAEIDRERFRAPVKSTM